MSTPPSPTELSSSAVVRCVCGSQNFVRVTPIRGFWREHVRFNDDGSEDFDNSESTTDDIVHGTPPKTMWCANCGKHHANPDAAHSSKLSTTTFTDIEVETALAWHRRNNENYRDLRNNLSHAAQKVDFRGDYDTICEHILRTHIRELLSDVIPSNPDT